jgi:7-carboxy-7-deazaguanine synthase
MKKDYIRVSEYFYSIQGEGITMGVPSVFIRLTGCNLLCSSKDWVCDTIPVWTKGEKKLVEEFVKEIGEQYNKYFLKGAHLVWTGGEPVTQQKAIVHFCDIFFSQYEFIPFMEIETNGTKEISNDLLKELDLINCSPKTSNSGMEQERTIKPDSLKIINNFENSIFKFVVAEEEDLMEIQDIIELLELKETKIVLMPAADCREQLESNLEMVADMCKENNYLMSTRMQVEIWNEVTGV